MRNQLVTGVSCVLALALSGCSVGLGTRGLQAGIGVGEAKFQARLEPNWWSGKTRYGKDRDRLNAMIADIERKRKWHER